MSTFLNRIREHFTDVLYIFKQELLQVIKDEGVLMFLVVVPLATRCSTRGSITTRRCTKRQWW